MKNIFGSWAADWILKISSFQIKQMNKSNNHQSQHYYWLLYNLILNIFRAGAAVNPLDCNVIVATLTCKQSWNDNISIIKWFVSKGGTLQTKGGFFEWVEGPKNMWHTSQNPLFNNLRWRHALIGRGTELLARFSAGLAISAKTSPRCKPGVTSLQQAAEQEWGNRHRLLVNWVGSGCHPAITFC